MTSTNPIVQNALNAKAANASGRKVKITIKSLTDKCNQTFEKVIDLDNLESWMRSAGIGGEYQRVMKSLATAGVNEFSIEAPCRVTISDI